MPGRMLEPRAESVQGRQDAWVRDTETLPPCARACPLDVFTPGLVAHAARFPGGAGARQHWNALPSACAWLCHAPCEAACARGENGSPIPLQRMARDAWVAAPRPRPPTTDGAVRAAVLGAGPAGLAAAAELGAAGVPVVLFDRDAIPGGSLNRIPPACIPRAALDADVAAITSGCAAFKPRFLAGRDLRIDDLFADGFGAVIVAIGLPDDGPAHVPGDDLAGVVDAGSFVARAAAGTPDRVSGRVVVIGSNHVAIEAARVARASGASRVTVVTGASLAATDAHPDDLARLVADGIPVIHLAVPVRVAGAAGRVAFAVFRKVAPRNADEPGPERLPRIPSSEFALPARLVLIAARRRHVPTATLEATGVPCDPAGIPRLDPATRMSSRTGVFLAGSAAGTGPRLIDAVASGRRAGRAAAAFLGAVPPAREDVDAPSPTPQAPGGGVVLRSEAERCLNCAGRPARAATAEA